MHLVSALCRAVLTLMIGGLAAACDGGQAPTATPSKPPPAAGSPTVPAIPAGPYAALIAKAQANGTMRVIVGLRGSYRPEGELADGPAVATQRAEISQARQALLDHLAGYQVSGVSTLNDLPLVALTVDAVALEHLASLPEVATIEEDRPVAPAAGP